MTGLICKCCNLPKAKVCNRCGESRHPDEYHVGKSICKVCRKVASANVYKLHKARNAIEGSQLQSKSSLSPQSESTSQ